MIFTRTAKKSALCISVLLSLASCATKPELPFGQYEGIAKAFADAYNCGVSGNMPSNTTYWAWRMLQSRLLSGYQYDEPYLKSRIDGIYDSIAVDITPRECNKIAMMAVDYQQREQEASIAQDRQLAAMQALNNALIQSQSQTQPVTPIHTTCTHVGNQISAQTFCDSY